MIKISLLLPTRERPEHVRKLLDNIRTQSAHPDQVELVMYADEDDPSADQLPSGSVGIRLVKIVGPRLTMGEYNTACLHRSSGAVVILINDDMIIRTRGWDQIVLDSAGDVEDGIFLAYPNDLHIGQRMCTFPILTRKACCIMEKPYPKEYRSGFIDWHLFDVFKRLKSMGEDRIFFLEDMVFEHQHYMAGKAELDATYRSKDYYADDWTFVELLPEREIIAKRLYAAIRKTPLPPLSNQNLHSEKPGSDFGALLHYARVFLFDSSLLLGDRLRVYIWMTSRYLRQRGYLPPKRPMV